MHRRMVVCATILGMLLGSTANAQPSRRRRVRGSPAVTASTSSVQQNEVPQVASIPVLEAYGMAQRMRVWLFTPPPGVNAWGLSELGSGHRLWALLPSCRQPRPDDPRDPCPIGRVAIEVLRGSGQVQSTEPRTLTSSPDARRVQAFVVPTTVEQVRIKILRRDESVRWQAAVDVSELGQLPVPEGTVGGPGGFNFALVRYPAN